ncbi:hypothetical protein ONZ45_g15280 [Pleurotus djamor]|nr:hypothetical protein ONZ45_g15280 [Pleurotus djamor]
MTLSDSLGACPVPSDASDGTPLVIQGGLFAGDALDHVTWAQGGRTDKGSTSSMAGREDDATEVQMHSPLGAQGTNRGEQKETSVAGLGSIVVEDTTYGGCVADGIGLGMEKGKGHVDHRPTLPAMRDESNLSTSQQSRAAWTKARANAHKHAKRRAQRNKVQDAAGTALKQVTKRRAREAQSISLGAVDAADLPHTERGYVGLKSRKPEVRKAVTAEEKACTISELVDMGFQYIPWSAQ